MGIILASVAEGHIKEDSNPNCVQYRNIREMIGYSPHFQSMIFYLLSNSLSHFKQPVQISSYSQPFCSLFQTGCHYWFSFPHVLESEPVFTISYLEVRSKVLDLPPVYIKLMFPIDKQY